MDSGGHLVATGADYPEEVQGNKMIELPGLPLLTGGKEKFNEDRRLFWEHAGRMANENWFKFMKSSGNCMIWLPTNLNPIN